MSKKLLLKNVVKFLAVCCTYMDRFKNKKFSLQPDSKSDRWGRIGERWPLDHHHRGPSLMNLVIEVMIPI